MTKQGSGRPARVVFMGTPTFAVPSLRALAETYDVVAVLTQPDRPAGRGRKVSASPVKRWAEAQGMPVLQPRSLRREPDAVAAIQDFAPDLIVVAAYGLILPASVLAIPGRGALNVHASLLPRWRGAAPIARALMAGDEETGVSIMLMDEGLDTGPVLAQRATPIQKTDTAGALTERLAAMGADLLTEVMVGWLAGEIVPVPQPEEGETYADRVSSTERYLDWSLGAAEIERRVRALEPEPGSLALWQDALLRIHAVTALPDGATVPPGTVSLDHGAPVVACAQGSLRLDVVQPAGGRPMPGAAFLRGRPGFAGSRLRAVG